MFLSVWNTVRLLSQVIVKHPEDILNSSAKASHPACQLDCSAIPPCLNNSESVVNGSFKLEYKFYIAIFVLSNQPRLFKAVTLGIFSVTHCFVVAVMYKVSAQLFIINGYLCEIQSVSHCPKLHPDFEEAQLY